MFRERNDSPLTNRRLTGLESNGRTASGGTARALLCRLAPGALIPSSWRWPANVISLAFNCVRLTRLIRPGHRQTPFRFFLFLLPPPFVSEKNPPRPLTVACPYHSLARIALRRRHNRRGPPCPKSPYAAELAKLRATNPVAINGGGSCPARTQGRSSSDGVTRPSASIRRESAAMPAASFRSGRSYRRSCPPPA